VGEDDGSAWTEQLENLLVEQWQDRDGIAHVRAEAERAHRESVEAHRRAGCFGS
jgi:hypothetical protein